MENKLGNSYLTEIPFQIASKFGLWDTKNEGGIYQKIDGCIYYPLRVWVNEKTNVAVKAHTFDVYASIRHWELLFWFFPFF